MWKLGEERREDKREDRRKAREEESTEERRKEEMKDVFVQYHKPTHLSYLLPSQTICPLATEGGGKDEVCEGKAGGQLKCVFAVIIDEERANVSVQVIQDQPEMKTEI